jgi:hypothetical protein
MNGWRDAPHQWKRYLFLPFGWELVRHQGMGWFRFDIFGFSIFFEW